VVGAPDDHCDESSEEDEPELSVEEDDEPPSVAVEPSFDEVVVVPDDEELDDALVAPSAGSWPSCTRRARTPKTATIDASAATAKRRREGARSMRRRLPRAGQRRLKPS
jgi:hypothetical protein